MSSALIMAGTAIAGAALQGYGKYQQAKSESKSYAAQAAVAEENAKQTRLLGAINEDRKREANRQQLSKMRAAIGEMGIGDSATAIGSLAQDAAAAEQNALDIRYQTASEANNLLQQGANLRFGAKAAKKQGRNAFYMGLIQGMGNGVSAYYKTARPVDAGGSKKDGYGFLWGE